MLAQVWAPAQSCLHDLTHVVIFVAVALDKLATRQVISPIRVSGECVVESDDRVSQVKETDGNIPEKLKMAIGDAIAVFSKI